MPSIGSKELVSLLPSLRVTKVSVGGKDISYVQEGRKEDGSFYVVLPEAMKRNAAFNMS